MTEGERLRDEAIRQAEAAANEEWRMLAAYAVESYAAQNPGAEITTDLLWSLLDGIAETHEGRAMGAVMLQASRSRIIAATDRYVKSERPECHARPIRVWRCL